jgi:nitrogen fixation/metabolism regulation signal transduction histidine kinase
VREKRRRIWIDRFQSYLFLRIAFYFVCYQVAVWALVAIERCLADTLETTFGAPVTASLFLTLAAVVLVVGFIFIYDAVLLAHRIVGPIYRIRKTIQALSAGEEVELVTLRQGDFLLELRDEFNELLKVLEQRGAVTLKQPKGKGQPAPAASGS